MPINKRRLLEALYESLELGGNVVVIRAGGVDLVDQIRRLILRMRMQCAFERDNLLYGNVVEETLVDRVQGDCHRRD